MIRFVTIVAVLVLAGCPPQKPGTSTADGQAKSGRDSEAVLEVGAEELSVDEVRKRFATIRSALPGVSADGAQLSTIADFELLADEAERKGYGDDPRVVNAVKDALAKTVPADKVTPGGDVKLDVAKVEAALEAGRKSAGELAAD